MPDDVPDDVVPSLGRRPGSVPVDASTAGGGRRRGRLAAVTAGLSALAVAGGLLLSHIAHSGSGAAPSVASVSSAPPGTGAAAATTTAGPIVVDALDRNAQWQDEDDTTGTCRLAGGLVVTTTSETRCGSAPDATFPSRQTIDVLAQLDEGSCAAIYFRIATEGAYRAAVCPDKVTLAVHGDQGTVTTVASAAHKSGAGAQAHEITVFADASQATISVDQSEVLRGPLSEPALVSGKVTFGGLAEDPRGDARRRVVFRQAVLRSGGPAPIALPGFLHGDATLDARLYYLDDQQHSAVVQPADLVPGREFCRRHKVDPGSSRCTASLVLDPGDLTVTVPVSRTYRVREFRAGQSSCVDPKTHAGRCASTYFRFNIWATENSPFPARVVIRGGTVVEVDQLDLP